MSHVLAEKTFTSNADIQVVEEIYKKTFGRSRPGKGAEVREHGLDHDGDMADVRYGAIPLCMRLETLNLSYNGNLVDIVELVVKLPPSLRS